MKTMTKTINVTAKDIEDSRPYSPILRAVKRHVHANAMLRWVEGVGIGMCVWPDRVRILKSHGIQLTFDDGQFKPFKFKLEIPKVLLK